MKSVRIDIERLDELMNLVGELVIDRNRLSSLSAELREVEGHDELTQSLLATSGRIVKTVDGLNRTVMQVRMLPVGMLFASFPRLVRDLGRSLGKQATLTIEGESTELDRSVLEKIRDPMVHLIRNAMDHGIEDPEGRRVASKPETGSLHLSARQAQGYVVIELADDGRGLDLELVREAAVSKGIVSREGTQLLTEDAVADLIFHPGLSTAESTTEVSGRGVGMDAVRREIDALGGSVELASERGRKTTVILRLPLTLASLPGLTVEAGGAAYAIPSSYVRETARVAPEDVTTVLGRRLINLRGSVLPLLILDVGSLLKIMPAAPTPAPKGVAV